MARLLLPNLRIPWLTFWLALSFLLAYYLIPGEGQAELASLLEAGASSGQLLADSGEWWRLITANWVHESPMHLYGNLFLLLNIGTLAELLFYRVDLALIYLFGGIGAMAVALLGGASVVTFGCSGMLFAALWATVIISYRYRRYLKPHYRRFFLWALPIYAILILTVGLVTPGVSVLAHLGGLLTGWLFGRLLIVRHPAGIMPYGWQKGLMAVLLLAVLPIAAYSQRTVPYLFVRSDYGGTFKAPSGWKIHGQKAQDGDSYMLENGLGVALLFDSELLNDGLSDEGELREYHESIQEAGQRQLWFKEVTLKRGFYRYHLSISCPVPLLSQYDRWWQTAAGELTLNEPERLKDARRRAENPAGTLYDYLSFAEELFLSGEYGEGQALLRQLRETFGDKPSILEKAERWQAFKP